MNNILTLPRQERLTPAELNLIRWAERQPLPNGGMKSMSSDENNAFIDIRHDLQSEEQIRIANRLNVPAEPTTSILQSWRAA